MKKLTKKNELELSKSISYSLWGLPPKTFIYTEDEVNDKYSNYLIDLYLDGYNVLKN